ncbi:ribonuclease domain-containing protein [Microvirgula aerodenitrificans]|uniref:ribonuclease domain-containing protein n=1 Tax=Microvirgula aerodenitrificans TaxID=57480 RepID=UPI00048BAD7F|nr:ribonuclease domain-containing protein [Microvirgula aerodenitrificans]
MYRFLSLVVAVALSLPVQAGSCDRVAREINAKLATPVNVTQFAGVLTALGGTGQLPNRYVSKQTARDAGWRPGRKLWSVPGLQGKSIGGDRFGNREHRLPPADWHEADLDYQGGKRNGKRLVYAGNGLRYVTVDHYQTFTEIPPCR